MPGHSKHSHPVFNKGHKASHNLLYSEYEAYLEWKIDPAIAFAKPRIERALMVATVLSSRAIHAMQQHDDHPPKKNKKSKD